VVVSPNDDKGKIIIVVLVEKTLNEKKKNLYEHA
jgi:hypothetical protein